MSAEITLLMRHRRTAIETRERLRCQFDYVSAIA